MTGTAYGAMSADGPMGEGLPMIDVKMEDGTSYSIVSEDPYSMEIAQAISMATTWAELPEVNFEAYQIVGEGR